MITIGVRCVCVCVCNFDAYTFYMTKCLVKH